MDVNLQTVGFSYPFKGVRAVQIFQNLFAVPVNTIAPLALKHSRREDLRKKLYHRKRMATEPAVHEKVAAVGGDVRVAVDFGQDDEQGLFGSHALVFHHRLLCALKVDGPWVTQLD